MIFDSKGNIEKFKKTNEENIKYSKLLMEEILHHLGWLKPYK